MRPEEAYAEELVTLTGSEHGCWTSTAVQFSSDTQDEVFTSL